MALPSRRQQPRIFARVALHLTLAWLGACPSAGLAARLHARSRGAAAAHLCSGGAFEAPPPGAGARQLAHPAAAPCGQAAEGASGLKAGGAGPRAPLSCGVGGGCARGSGEGAAAAGGRRRGCLRGVAAAAGARARQVERGRSSGGRQAVACQGGAGALAARSPGASGPWPAGVCCGARPEARMEGAGLGTVAVGGGAGRAWFVAVCGAPRQAAAGGGGGGRAAVAQARRQPRMAGMEVSGPWLLCTRGRVRSLMVALTGT